MNRLSWRLCLALAIGGLAACEGPDLEGSVTDPDVEAETAAIINGSLTTSAPWLVRLDLPGASCSGNVLTEHWILTAAHCVKGLPRLMNITVRWANVLGGAESVYQGQARYYSHRNYTSGPTNDIALIKLEAAAGIDLTRTERAKLWGYTKPWTSRSDADRRFLAMGWGRAGENSCPANSAGQKRFSSDNRLDRAAPDALVVSTPRGWRTVCLGDSGGPFLFRRGGQLVAFAIATRIWPDLIVAGKRDEGTLLPPKLPWMYQTSRDAGLALICATAGTAGGDVYLQCRERPHSPNPPPPGTLCSQGRHCCEPNPDGPQCLRCVAATQQCQ